MTEKRFCKGEYTYCRYDICEIEKDDEPICTVALKDADFIIEVLNENEQLKQFQEKVFDLINDEIHKSEEEYNHAVKNGMPSNSTYENIGLLEYLKEELEK